MNSDSLFEQNLIRNEHIFLKEMMPSVPPPAFELFYDHSHKPHMVFCNGPDCIISAGVNRGVGCASAVRATAIISVVYWAVSHCV